MPNSSQEGRANARSQQSRAVPTPMTILPLDAIFMRRCPSRTFPPSFFSTLFSLFFFLHPLSRQFIFATARSSLIELRFLVHNFEVTSVIDNTPSNDGRCRLISGDRWKCTRVNDRNNVIDRHFSFFSLSLSFPASMKGEGHAIKQGSIARK